MQYMKKTFFAIKNCAVHSADTSEEKLQKQILILISVITGILAVFWGSVYFALGYYISASISLVYALFSFLALLYVQHSRSIRFLLISQLVLVLTLPFLLMWSLGGFSSGSYVMIWAFYSPMVALVYSRRHLNLTFGLFVFLMMVSSFIDNLLIANIDPLPKTVVNIFTSLNIIAGFGGILYMMKYYIYQRDYITQAFVSAEAESKKLLSDQKTLLSLFDKGDSVLFKWKNEEAWPVEYVSTNAEKVLTYTIHDFTSQRVSYASCIHADDIEHVMEEVLDAVEKKKEFFKHDPYRILTKDNQVKWVLDYTVTEKDSDGNILYFIGYINDITKDKENEIALQIAKANSDKGSRAKSEFLANMSHEIRTPLNGIIGLTNLTLQTNLNSRQREYLTKAVNSSSALLNIINDILDHSKIEANKLNIEEIPFELDAIFRTVSDLFSYQGNEKGVLLLYEIGDTVSNRLIGDPFRITQVLTNLVGNALKFTDRGKIEVKVEMLNQVDKKQLLRFSVKDSGVGVPKEQQKQLFDAFTQADTSNTRKYGGTGLGLTICKRLVELMGGVMDVESQEGIGSVFEFKIALRLNIAIDDEVDAKTSDSIQEHFHMIGRILLVEDNEINQLVAQASLEQFGIEVVIAENGLIAVEKVKAEEFDMIFMDLQMPIMGGFEASREIRKFNQNIPIIALSAAVMEQDKEQTKEAGMNEHVAKPFEIETLKAVLMRYLDFQLLSDQKSLTE